MTVYPVVLKVSRLLSSGWSLLLISTVKASTVHTEASMVCVGGLRCIRQDRLLYRRIRAVSAFYALVVFV